MNSVTTPLLSMIDSSAHPENITNTSSGPSDVLKPGGLAADVLFNIHSEKKAVPKTEAAMTSHEERKKKSMTESKDPVATVSASTLAPILASALTQMQASAASSHIPPTLPVPIQMKMPTQIPIPVQMPIPVSIPATSSQKAETPQPPASGKVSYNVHLAALMRQYEVISQGGSKLHAPSSSDAGPARPKQRESTPKAENFSTEKKTPSPTTEKPAVPIQHIFPPPVRNLASSSPLTTPISPLLNFGHPFAGFGWPMMPFANPFAPAFMQCYPYPPQLSLLQNQFTFQQPSPTPVSQQLAPSGKKRKASVSEATVATNLTKTQAKRVKEIGNESPQN
uniref:Uncharacterized protein n=2 Tax=Caenorhabditis japonica TaxID=281687 RepID=A0A8R1IKX5_CAEJA